MILYLLSILLAALSGVPGLFMRKGGGRIATMFLGLSAVLGIGAAAGVLFGDPSSGAASSLALPSTPLIPWGLLRLDPITAFFLIPLLLLSGCASLYGLGYWGDAHEGARGLRFFFGLLVSFLALLVGAAHAFIFLLAWEGMALVAFLLVMTEDKEPETRRAAWLYLVSTHTGTLFLFGAFAMLARAMGSFAFSDLPLGFAASGNGTVMFVLFLLGFTFKAGAIPLHIWLPPAHAAAPSHVSAVMSGVLIKMGILGLVRLVSWVPDPPLYWGGTLVTLGALSGIMGVALALGQHDLKRLLAYHSIENIGIILLGLGLGLIGKSSGNAMLQVLGFAGALLHVLNHCLFKGLLFLAAGSVVHATGTRNLERLGGLGHAMPKTAAAFLVGAWAICGLPPLNGFVSEWFIYMGAFQGLGHAHWVFSLVTLVALGVIGALALACFAKAYGAVFLGSPRTPVAAQAHESPLSMLAPMGILAMACAAVGLAPSLAGAPLDRVVANLTERGLAPHAVSGLANLPMLTVVALPLLILALILWRWVAAAPGRKGLPTWDCGYAAPTPRMQYTASSLAGGLVGGMSWMLWPMARGGRVHGDFPFGSRYQSHVPDPVLDRVIVPGFRGIAHVLSFFRFLQSGHLSVYLLYILLTLLTLLIWMGG
jgi:hydrogenase-4 component B